MNPEERIYRAINGEKLDRIPTLSLLADPNITNQVLDSKPDVMLDFLNSEKGSRLVDRYARQISKLFKLAMFLFGNRIALMNYRLGFDAMLAIYWPGKLLDHRRIEDVYGRLFNIVDDGYGNAYPMYSKGLIESPEEWRRRERPSFAEYASAGAMQYRLWRMIWKNKLAIVPFVGPGLWENSWQPMGFEKFVVLMRKDPAFVHEVAGYFTTWTVAAVDAYCKAGARVIMFADDLAYKSGPMLSPEMLEKFYGRGYRQITQTAHRYGAKILIHCCGNTRQLLPKFVEWGFDGAHAFEPPAGNDMAEARRVVGKDFCLVGNIDVTHTLVDAPREEVEDAVAAAIHDTSGGGFILAPAHSHASVSVENIRWMINAAKSTQ